MTVQHQAIQLYKNNKETIINITQKLTHYYGTFWIISATIKSLHKNAQNTKRRLFLTAATVVCKCTTKLNQSLECTDSCPGPSIMAL